MKMIRCSGMGGKCEEVNFLRHAPYESAFVESGWHQVSDKDFLCKNCSTTALCQHWQYHRDAGYAVPRSCPSCHSIGTNPDCSDPWHARVSTG